MHGIYKCQLPEHLVLSHPCSLKEKHEKTLYTFKVLLAYFRSRKNSLAVSKA